MLSFLLRYFFHSSLHHSLQGAVNDVENILHVLEEFKTPMSFAYHVGKDLIVNGVDIIHEIGAAVDDWEAQSYRDCGVQIGTALNQLIIGEEEQVKMTPLNN